MQNKTGIVFSVSRCRKRCSNSHSKHQLFENKWSVEPFTTVEEEWETTCVFLHTASLNRLQIKMYTLGNSLLCIFLNYPLWIRLLVWEVSTHRQQPFQRSSACAFISCKKKKSQKGHFQFLRGIGKQIPTELLVCPDISVVLGSR